MKLRLLRHATLHIDYAGQHLLVDPMLGAKETMDAIANTPNPLRNPLVDLPLDAAELNTLLGELDAVLVTHLHRDHWDLAAAEMLNKATPIYCQPGDEARIAEAGFERVRFIDESMTIGSMTVHRTGGQHGSDALAELMGQVRGFVLSAEGEPTLYIAGDTIFAREVENALTTHQPAITVLNAGGARFLEGDPITMTTADLRAVAEAAPGTLLVPVHMDSINHCLLTRDLLREEAPDLLDRMWIPADGETRDFSA